MAYEKRRRYPRVPIDGPVLILVEGAAGWSCHLRDISLGGALSECDHPPQIGDSIRVAFDVSGERVTVQCRVVHGARTSPEPEPRYRIGVEFEPLSLRDSKRISDYVQDALTR